MSAKGKYELNTEYLKYTRQTCRIELICIKDQQEAEMKTNSLS